MPQIYFSLRLSTWPSRIFPEDSKNLCEISWTNILAPLTAIQRSKPKACKVAYLVPSNAATIEVCSQCRE